MKKLLKRISATLVAGVLAVAAVPHIAFAGEARDAEIAAYKDGTAYLSINNSDWADFDATYTTAEITGNGTYTVSMEAKEPQNLAQFNALQVKNGETVMGNQSILTVDSIKINGSPIEMTGYSYTCSADGAGIETRVNLYNEWNKPTDDSGAIAKDTRCEQDAAGATAMLWGADKLEGFQSVEVTFTVSHFGENVAEEVVKNKEAKPLPAEGTLTYIQYADKDWANQTWSGSDAETIVCKNATVTGAGEYTVGIEINAKADAPAKGFAFIDVEILNGEEYFPYGYMNIKNVKVNGADAALEGAPYTSSDDGVTTRVNLYNEWVDTSNKDFGGRLAEGIDAKTASPVSLKIVTEKPDEEIKSVEVTYELFTEGGIPFGSYVETKEEPVDTTGPWTAFMMFSDGKEQSWQNFNPGVGTEATVTGDGVYEVAIKAEDVNATTKAEPQQGALVFLVDIQEMGKAMKSVGTLRANDKDELKDTDAKVKIAVFVDGNKITTNSDSLVLGDIEGNGRFRIDISNAYDGSGTGIGENPACDTAALTPEKEVRVVFAISGTGVGTAGDTNLEKYLEEKGYVEKVTEAPTTEKATEATTAAPTTDTTEKAKTEEKSGLSTGAIIGIVCGGVAVVAAAVCGILVAKKKKKD